MKRGLLPFYFKTFISLTIREMDKEQLAKTFANLSTEQRADIIMAIVCGITGKKMPQVEFNSEMVSTLTAILSFIR